MEDNSSLPMCNCGQIAILKTAWTNANPGRRFLGCSRYGTMGACNYFAWFDDETCDHTRVVILGLLKKLRKYELEADKAREKRTSKKKIVAVIIMVVVAFILGTLM
ncbi:uncharacterized protein LOC126669631 [Mercurialis annua]|uniref:uncharacterized protein LOC126669631 n=1 Tax=Mercurialis annua TaxID=3986 RepID=UPI00215E7F19|nr:uncharacterized protein LOC126669631 [Mercurialis annua]